MPIYFLEFLLLCIIVIYPFGKIPLLFLDFKLNFWEDLLISFNIGTVLLTLCVFILWRFSLYNLTLPIIILPFFCLLYFFVKKKGKLIFHEIFSINIPLLLVLLFSIFVQSLITFQAGNLSLGGIKLPFAFANDGTSYISLINSIQKSIPPQNPSYSGEMVQNYHYLSYVFAASVGYITNIPNLFLSFKIVTLFFTFLFSTTLYMLIKNLVRSKFLHYLSVPFIILSSNYYYLIGYIYPSAYITPSVLWVDEYTTRLVNNQLLFSYVIILTILFLLLTYARISRKGFIILISILIGSLVGIKVFGAIIFISSFTFLALYKSFKKNFDYLKITLGCIVSSVLVYLSATTSLRSILIISPFWFIKNVYETKDHLNYVTWELQRQTYLDHKNYLRIIQLYIQGFGLFILGNLGGKLVGLFAIFLTNNQRKREIISLVALMGIIGITLPMIFIVRGTAWNTIQFFYYSILSFGILTIIFIDYLYLKRKFIAVILFFLLWISMIPGVIYSSRIYLNEYKSNTFSAEITQAANFLSSQKKGVILISPDYFSNAFIPAMTKKNAFFADEMMLNVQLIPYEKRKQDVINFFTSTDNKYKQELLVKNNISYIFANIKYLRMLNLLLSKQPEFKNSEVIIYNLK